MTKYTVTTELKTPWWKKVLRFVRIMKSRKKFELLFIEDYYSVGALLETSSCKVLIIGKQTFL